ncbi:MAG: Na+/H+ antiporter NhaA [Bacteroidales bacterium]|nr:Na+/H+ antiporter NhaA [Bacteroidales bacterium]
MKKDNRRTQSLFNIGAYIRQESLGGIILILVTIVALIWANSGFYDSYHYLWHELKFGITFGDFELKKSIHLWINDGLMAIFFFMIGLEIKREVLAGELSSIKKASLPLGAAVGGMVVPAAFYAIINFNNPEYIHGWGIPMATDIAFALGLMSILGPKIPVNLKVFLTALAIADDLGAILIIAIFYTDTIHINELLQAGGFLGVLMIANRLGVRRTSFYALVGFLGVWMSFLFSGVHATIAGVLIALTIPVRPKISDEKFISSITDLTTKFINARPNNSSLRTDREAKLINDIDKLSDDAHTPLQKLEHALHPITAFIILPLFALSNAGVKIDGNIFNLLSHPIALGIIAGLLLGKSIGISLFSKFMVMLKLADLPEGVKWSHIYGASFFAGIGFTMSIFISVLAFVPDEFVEIAKVGIITASLFSAIVGFIILSRADKSKK